MDHIEYPRVIKHPLVSSTVGAHYGVPFSLQSRKWKCCMWLVNKVKIIFQEWVRFMDLKWTNLNTPGSYTTWVSCTFGVHYGVPFSLHAGKGKCCMWLANKVEIYFPKMGFRPNGPI